MNNKGTTLVELLAAVGILAGMTITIAAVSGMVASTSAATMTGGSNSLSVIQANVALESIVERVKKAPPLPNSVTYEDTLYTCTYGASPNGGFLASQPGYWHDYTYNCPGHICNIDKITRSLCFKIIDGTAGKASGVEYANTKDQKIMEAVFQVGNTVVYTANMDKYNASDPSTYQTLTGSIVKTLSFSAGADNRLIANMSLLNSKTTSGVSNTTSGDSTQDNVRTSVMPDLTRSSSALARSAVN